MEKANTTTKENLIEIITHYIKAEQVKLKPNSYESLYSIHITNWFTCGKDKKWSSTEITINRVKYYFYDKQITDEDFISMLEQALKASGCLGRVLSDEWEEYRGLYCSPIKHKRFQELIIFSNACDEFVALNKLFRKYANKELDMLQIYTSNICGKRTPAYTESCSGYICFQPNKCKHLLDQIKSIKKSNDILLVEVKELIDRGEDYDYACRHETEWYGQKSIYLDVTITTPKGKVKGNIKTYANISW